MAIDDFSLSADFEPGRTLTELVSGDPATPSKLLKKGLLSGLTCLTLWPGWSELYTTPAPFSTHLAGALVHCEPAFHWLHRG